MKKNQLAFTLIELLIVSAIIAVLATIALPLYNQYTIVATAGANMKGLTSFTNKTLTCQQTNIGCLSLTAEATNIPQLSISPAPSQNIQITLTWKDYNDRCIITSQISKTGVISYQAASAGKGDDSLCQQGAGL